jgi:hypothetical protein
LLVAVRDFIVQWLELMVPDTCRRCRGRGEAAAGPKRLMNMLSRGAVVFACLSAFVGASPARAQSSLSGGQLRIARLTGPVTIDGTLSEDAWRRAERVERWYETNPGDNVEPKVKSVAYLAYDDKFFYAAFEFDDPRPAAIRAPVSDRDNVSGNATDYAGVILDTRNDGRTAVLLLATPRGVQYDADTDDAAGEDQSPDYYWDAAARITDRGWTLEIRVPFSSLRYRNAEPQTWGILLYRNYPRDFRYQMFSAPLPRGGNCFVCRANTLVGLEELPSGGHLVAAPYASFSGQATSEDGPGTPLTDVDTRGRGGLDVKWTPDADNVADFTINPDFSQVESDTAQISTNERFALFFSEKRPFFLEGVNLLRTPIQAVYTRTITSPRWGSRLTGKSQRVSYTALVADDKGGGSVVLPGTNGSDLADQPIGSLVFVGRARRDFGLSFVSMIATDRELHDDQGHNRVIGPDFQWRFHNELVTGQALVSTSRTPNRPDLADEWTGQNLHGHALDIQWSHNTTHFDAFAQGRDLSDGFRADTGFVPQVGIRETSGGGGWTFRPTGFVRRLRTFVNATRQTDSHGDLVDANVTPGVGMDVKWSGFAQIRMENERTRAGTTLLTRRQFSYVVQFSPTRRISQVSVDGKLGPDIDFTDARPGRGATVNLYVRVNPTDHLELEGVRNQRVLHADDAFHIRRRLFVSRVSRLRATYNFTSRFFGRLIAQQVTTDRDPSAYVSRVDPKSSDFSGSVLVAYKLNWQSVLFVGYGDDRSLDDLARLRPSSRQFFMKFSYAVQR